MSGTDPAVKEKVREIAAGSFTDEGFEQYWAARWTLLGSKSPEQFLAEGGAEEDVLTAADSFASGAYI